TRWGAALDLLASVRSSQGRFAEAAELERAAAALFGANSEQATFHRFATARLSGYLYNAGQVAEARELMRQVIRSNAWTTDWCRLLLQDGDFENLMAVVDTAQRQYTASDGANSFRTLRLAGFREIAEYRMGRRSDGPDPALLERLAEAPGAQPMRAFWR